MDSSQNQMQTLHEENDCRDPEEEDEMDLGS